MESVDGRACRRALHPTAWSSCSQSVCLSVGQWSESMRVPVGVRCMPQRGAAALPQPGGRRIH